MRWKFRGYHGYLRTHHVYKTDIISIHLILERTTRVPNNCIRRCMALRDDAYYNYNYFMHCKYICSREKQGTGRTLF